MKIRELFFEIMDRYAISAESICMTVMEYGELVVKSIKYLLAGLIVLLIWIFLAVTMPVWYLPYRYLTKRNMGGINETGSDRDRTEKRIS